MTHVVTSLPQKQPTRRDAVLKRLGEIDESTSKPRTVRELQLGNASTLAYVQALEAEAATLRAELAVL